MDEWFADLLEYTKTEKDFAKICRTTEYVAMKAEDDVSLFRSNLQYLITANKESIYIDGDIDHFTISPMEKSYIRIQFDNSSNIMVDNYILLSIDNDDIAKFIKKYSEANCPIHAKFYIKKIRLSTGVIDTIQPEGYVIPDIDRVEFFSDIKFPHLICPECKKDYGNLKHIIREYKDCYICSDSKNVVNLEYVDTLEKYNKIINEV